MKNLSVKNIMAFIVLYDTLNINKTAEILSISPSAVMKRIKILEEDIGNYLFVKNSGLKPSLEAVKLISIAKEILNDFEKFPTSKTTLNKVIVDDTLKIGCELWTAKTAARYTSAFIKRNYANISIDTLTPVNMNKKIISGECDVIFTSYTPPLHLPYHEIGVRDLFLVVPSVLANIEKTMDNNNIHSTIGKYPLIVMHDEYQSSHVSNYIKINNFNKYTAIFVDSTIIQQSLVSVGCGCAFIPEESLLYNNSVIPIKINNTNQKIFMVWNLRHSSKIRDAFISNVDSLLTSLQATVGNEC